jgi:hypothetical protein
MTLVLLAGGLMTMALAQDRDLPPAPGPPQPVESEGLVGAYYFPGWSHADRWHCIKAMDDVLHPLLGYYREGDPAVADWHIKWALEHGVDFFAFDYYSHQGSEMLEEALRAMLESESIDQFRFCLNWCNHQPPETQDAEELRRFGDVVIDAYLTHPSYLRIDGRPVLMILSGYSFVRTLGVEGASEAFDELEARCREAGLPGLYLVSCEGHISGVEDIERGIEAGIDAFCLYNYPYAGSPVTGPGGEYLELGYEHLIEQGRDLWAHWADHTSGRFWPTVMPGWDRRPWTKDQDLRRVGSTPELFEQSLTWAREAMNDDQVVMIEAWNEWGEGSVLEPSIEWGFDYLEAVRRAFCETGDWPEGVAPAPEERPDVDLPRTDRWSFNYDPEGWQPIRLEGFRQSWGALEAVSTGPDPQLSGPKSYLPCDQYSVVEIRMRAEATEEGNPEAGRGEVFWATTMGGLSGERAMGFDVPLDAEWHVHVIPVGEHPLWSGTLEHLRLDPVDVAGVRFQVDFIALR